MLVSLHVKNLALIKETEVNFKQGLNILSGETGAGKSIIIGSINLALGARADKDMIRNGAEYALIELVFQVTDKNLLSQIALLDIPVEEDGLIIIQRKIQATRSIFKVCGETVTTKQIKDLSELLIDIHGQHEHQSLLYKKNHMTILDAFAGEELEKVKEDIKECYHTYKALQKELEELSVEDGVAAKELSLAEFEYDEIMQAQLQPGEDDELEAAFRKMSNSRQIAENVSKAYQLVCEKEQSAADLIGYGAKELQSVEQYDTEVRNLSEELANIDSLLGDFSRNIAEYLSSLEFDAEVFAQTEERLNLLNHLKLKYGGTIEKVQQYQDALAEKIEKLQNADAYKEKLRKELTAAEEVLRKQSQKTSKIRAKEAAKLSKDMVTALTDLNFLDVKFEIQVREKEELSSNGCDDVEFMISTNPGEPLKSLGSVASGGELSRIMLAIKTVLASRDQIPTMIFDEIDAGISGKTAWKVAEKLGVISKNHQIICITHLPQIAAMADHHFMIAKEAVNQSTQTSIYELKEKEVLQEMARLLGGEKITDTVLKNAKELLATAKEKK